jgi:hypothetical protein
LRETYRHQEALPILDCRFAILDCNLKSKIHLERMVLFAPNGAVTISGFFVDANDNPLKTGSNYSVTGTVSASTAQTLATCLGLAALPAGAVGFLGQSSGNVAFNLAGIPSNQIATGWDADLQTYGGSRYPILGGGTYFVLGRAS